jgi:putative FmdB family regulatory protein
MPIYEYRCESCGHELEAIQKMSDEPLIDCPTCREPALKKRISAVAFRLKGSGWYETDFKTGEKKKNLAKGDASSTDTKPTDTGKAESKGKDSANKDNTNTTKKTAAVSSK